MTLEVLVTNDDGYDAVGLDVLATSVFVDERYALTVVAPSRDQSGRGQGVSIHPMSVRARDLGHAGRAFVVDGTPADCVRLACSSPLVPTPRLVLAGVNNGWNFGPSLYASGTVGAAREAALHKIPAIAISGPPHGSWQLLFPMVERFLDDWARWALDHPGLYLSVNLPARSPTRWTWARPTPYAGVLCRSRKGSGDAWVVEWQLNLPDAGAADADTDVGAVHRGIIAVTACRSDVTADDAAVAVRPSPTRIPS